MKQKPVPRSLQLVFIMSKRIVLPVGLGVLLGACALQGGGLQAQAANAPHPEATRLLEPRAPSAMASLPVSQGSLGAATILPSGEPTADEMEPENPEDATAESSVTEPSAAPPPLPPCPASVTGLQDRVAYQICQRVRAEPPPNRLSISDTNLRSVEPLIRFYAGRHYQPGWLDASGRPAAAAEALLAALAEADQEGLRSVDYAPNRLRQRLDTVRQGAAVRETGLAEFDLLFTDTFLTYGSHLLAGRVSPRKVDPEWVIKPSTRDVAAALQQALSQGQGGIRAALQELLPKNQGYVRLRESLHRYRQVQAAGGWPTVAAGLKPGSRGPRVQDLRARLHASGDLTGSPTEAVFDSSVTEALRRFQRRHGLGETGIVNAATQTALNVPVAQRIRQVELNMERWRWLPDDFGNHSRYILVNIPSFTMKVIEDGKRVFESNVVVGRQERQTPALTADMAYLVLSPKWYVPRTIAVKDKLPQLQRNPKALARQNIRVYNSAGQEINPTSVNWRAVSARNFNYHFRQDAGPRNALGGIKFMFPNPYSIYLHDTPTRNLFGRSQRTFSSGCVRVSKPLELAQYLLKHDPKWTRERIKSASVSGKQRIVNLPETVPVYLIYWTAWIDEEGLLNFRNDIYKRDKPMVRALYAGETIGKGA